MVISMIGLQTRSSQLTVTRTFIYLISYSIFITTFLQFLEFIRADQLDFAQRFIEYQLRYSSVMLTYIVYPIGSFIGFQFFYYLQKVYDQGKWRISSFPKETKKKDLRSYFKLYAGNVHRLDVPQIMVIILGYVNAAYYAHLPWLPLLSILCVLCIYAW